MALGQPLARPVASAQRAAGEYSRLSGLHVIPNPEATVAPEAARQVAAAYDRLPSFDRSAVPAYRAMRDEVGRQFDHLTKPETRGGLGMTVEVTKHDPYETHEFGRLFDDISNGHMKVLSSAVTGGHPFFSDDENDMFRAVHDVFGHAGVGRGVDAHGEDAAYQKHASMFSPLARRALATETRGQNSSMNNSGGVFPEQKVALLPERMEEPNFMAPTNPGSRLTALRDAARSAREQGLV